MTAVKTVEHQLLEALNRVGGVITDSHINYGDEHSSTHLAISKLLRDETGIDLAAEEIAKRFAHDKIEAVASMFNEHMLAEKVAKHLERIGKRPVTYLYVKRLSVHAKYFRVDSNCVSPRGKDVLVVRGLLGSGFTTDKVMNAVRTAGGRVLGLGVIYSRGVMTSEDVHQSFKIEALMSFDQKRWCAGPETCPLCKEGVPFHPKAGLGDPGQKKKV